MAEGGFPLSGSLVSVGDMWRCFCGEGWMGGSGGNVVRMGWGSMAGWWGRPNLSFFFREVFCC